MSISRIFLSAVMALSMVALTGCVDNNDPADMPPLPPALNDPADGASGRDLTAGSGWGADANSATFGADAASGDSWTAADPGNNLGFPIVYFAYDSDVLVPTETAKLDEVAKYLADKEQLGLIIEGHCDQRGTEEYNRALGERRANAVRAYIAGVGLADSRIKTVSYGKDRLAVEGSGEAVWSQNRRGVLVPAYMK